MHNRALNNEIVFDHVNKKIEFNNPKPRNGQSLAQLYTDHFQITETTEKTYIKPLLLETPLIFLEYTSSITSTGFTIINGVLINNNFLLFTPLSLAEEECLEIIEENNYCSSEDYL